MSVSFQQGLDWLRVQMQGRAPNHIEITRCEDSSLMILVELPGETVASGFAGGHDPRAYLDAAQMWLRLDALQANTTQ